MVPKIARIRGFAGLVCLRGLNFETNSKAQIRLVQATLLPTARHAPAFERLVRHVHQHSEMLRTLPIGGYPGWTQAEKLIGGLLSVAEFHTDWLQDLESWEPQAESAYSQFASLARHLFAKSPVPNFMTSVWFEGRSRDALRHQSWFKHLCRGYGIRGVETPIKLTKIMARHFLQAHDLARGIGLARQKKTHHRALCSMVRSSRDNSYKRHPPLTPGPGSPAPWPGACGRRAGDA